MRVHQEIMERIRYVEGFEVVASGGAVPGLPSNEYRFNRAASRKMVVGEWLETRFYRHTPVNTGHVIHPDGEPLNSDVPIGVVRDEYHEYNRRSCHFPGYGQSLSYEYSDNVEKTVLEIGISLHEIVLCPRQHFQHPPSDFQHEEIPVILEKLAEPLKLSSSHEIKSDCSNLYEASPSYKYFGVEEFERLEQLSR